jgi:uncharacterized protein YggU (UPF0235/DUF167 family)
MQERPWTRTESGLRLMVRLTPRAGENALGGLREIEPGQPLLLARVTAPPLEGQANAAVIKLVANSLGLPKSAVTIEAGATSRIKALEIAGDPAILEPLLERLV